MANIVKHQHIQEKLLQEINAAVKPGEEITEEDLRRMPYLKSVIFWKLFGATHRDTLFCRMGYKRDQNDAFGAGRRACPAITMALLHEEYFVANLVRDFAWTAENGGDIDLSEKRTGFHHGHEEPTSRACFSKNTLKMVLNTKNMLFKLFRPFLAWNAPAGYSTVKGTRHLQSQAWFRSFLRCCVIVLVSGID
ncbi:hypothetical protein OIU78_013993 [Salix suchowensis]|nr:hypothetical protein OIU78_013993 [Salix suchowensis]